MALAYESHDSMHLRLLNAQSPASRPTGDYVPKLGQALRLQPFAFDAERRSTRTRIYCLLVFATAHDGSIKDIAHYPTSLRPNVTKTVVCPWAATN